MNIQCNRCARPFHSGVTCPHPVKKGQTLDLCVTCCFYVSDASTHPLNYGSPPTMKGFLESKNVEIQNLKAEIAALKAQITSRPDGGYMFGLEHKSSGWTQVPKCTNLTPTHTPAYFPTYATSAANPFGPSSSSSSVFTVPNLESVPGDVEMGTTPTTTWI